MTWARLLLLLSFTATTALAPQAMASCPRHAPATTPAPVAPGEAHASHADADHGSVPASEHEHDGHDEHGAHCCCLGQCCPGGSVAHPAPDAAPLSAAPGAKPADGAHPAAARLDPDPWTLPYPNAPPVRS